MQAVWGRLQGALGALAPPTPDAVLLVNPRADALACQALWDKFVAYRKAGFVKPFHIRRTPYKCRMYSLGGFIVKEYSGCRQKVESEVRILQQLGHEGLISYEFVADEGSRISIVMAWAGAPLREARPGGAGAFGEDAARHMAAQLAAALAFLHSRGIVHRDVKPDNIGVAPDDRVSLFDWGEAVRLADVAAMGDRELSRVVGVAGTPLFMPPESLNYLTRRPSEDGGSGGGGGGWADGVPALRATLSPALDVWGLGTVVFFLLAGRDIFVGDADWELEELADVVNCSSGVALPEGAAASFAARDFLARCLERCPGRRASAAELLAHPWLRGAASASEVEAARAADARAASVARHRSGSFGSLRRALSAARLGGGGGGGGDAPGSLSRGASFALRRSASGASGGGGGRLSAAGSAPKLCRSGSVSPPRPPLVEGAAVCEVTVRMKQSPSGGSLHARAPSGGLAAAPSSGSSGGGGGGGT